MMEKLGVRRITYLGGTLLLVMGLAFLLGAGAGFFGGGDLTADPEPPEQEPSEPDPEPEPEPDPEPEPEPDIRSMTIISVGDITAHSPQINQAHVSDGEYDFSPSFEFIAPHLKRADLAVANFETCQAGPEITFLGYRGYTGFPCFNAPVELSEAVKEAGIDLVSTAHNHSMDRGLSGLKITLENLRGVGLTTYGTHMNEEEQMTPVIAEVDGIRVAFLSWTFSTNVIPVPEGHEYAVNFIENFHTVQPIIEEIQRARDAGADLVAVSMHWGAMYVTEPHPRLREIAAELARGGADLILGGHPHVVQPMEWLYNEQEDGSERPTLVTYSMGNFISNQHYPINPTDLVQYGKLLEFGITKDMDTGETWISSADYDITWVHREWRHRVLSLSEVLAGDPADFNLAEARVEELRDGFRRNVEIIEKYGFSEDAPEGVR